MILVRSIGLLVVLVWVGVLSGCQAMNGDQISPQADVFLTEIHSDGSYCLAFPVQNKTDRPQSLHRWYALALSIVSMKADGQTVLPGPEGHLPDDLDSEMILLKAGASRGYIFHVYSDFVLVVAKNEAASSKEWLDELEFDVYTIPQKWKTLNVSYVVRESALRTPIYEGEVTFIRY